MGAYSKLHNYTAKKLRDNLPNLRVMENYHPDWLLSPIGTRLELDIFLPEISAAIEIQGAQHFSFTSFFHKSYSDFEKQKEYDEEKRNLCYGAGVRLVEVCTEMDADILVTEIRGSIVPAPKYSYSCENIFRKEKSKRNPEGNVKQRKTAWNATDEAAEERLTSLIEKVRQYEAGEISAEPEKVKKWNLVIQNNGHLVSD